MSKYRLGKYSNIPNSIRMTKIDVTPLEIRDYAVSLGWQLVKEAIKDGLFVLNSPSEKYKQLIFPIEPNASDYESMAELSIRKIAETVRRSIPIKRF